MSLTAQRRGLDNPFGATWGTRTYLMGVINVAPDSFSGDGVVGGAHEVAILARLCRAAGADVIDIGGESTRPASVAVGLDEELARVIPAIEAACAAVDTPISVDTTKAEVARQALRAGASIVNDVSGAADPALLEAVAQASAGLVLVHYGKGSRGEDVVTAVREGLQREVGRACGYGVSRESIVVDPGLGFGKSWRENFEIFRRLQELTVLDRPILVGPSRKGMIGKVLGVGITDRMEGTLALVALAIAHGADMVRVHDVREMARAARMSDTLVR